MTRLELERAVYRRVGKHNPDSPDAATQTRIRHFLNQRHRRLMSMPGMAVFQRVATTFNSVDGTSEYTLEDTERILHIRETDNDRTLSLMSLSEYRDIAPDPDANSGTPTHYVVMSYAQPDITIALWPQPSSAITYQVDRIVPVSDLGSDNDEPLLPAAFHDVLELGAALDELSKGEDPRYGIVREEYEGRVRDLRYFVAVQTMSQNPPREWSSLGPWFPADYWR